MRYIFLFIFLSIATPTVYAADCAQSINQVSDLGEATKQGLIVECEKKKLEAAEAVDRVLVTDEDGNISTEKLSEWGRVAQEWAKALGLAASELGIAVDEFLGTTAGKLTAIIIIYKVMGSALLGLLIGIPLMLFSWFIAYKLFRFVSIDGYERVEVTGFGGKTKFVSIPKYRSVSKMSDNETSALWFIALASIAVTLFILFVIVL